MTAERTCFEPGCDRPVYARQLCNVHYHRQRAAMIAEGTWIPIESPGWQMDHETRVAAGKKGGARTAQDLDHMRLAGSKGGKTTSQDREHMSSIARTGVRRGYKRPPLAQKGQRVHVQVRPAEYGGTSAPTETEIRVLAAIAEAGSVPAVAKLLGITFHQAHHAVDTLKKKTGLGHLPQLIAWAFQEGWLVALPTHGKNENENRGQQGIDAVILPDL